MLTRIFMLFFLLSTGLKTHADGHNPSDSSAVATISNQCFFKEGTDQGDIEDAMKSLTKWATKNHPGILSVLTPLFRMQSDGYGDLIIQSWMPFERLADFDEAVVKNGAGIREDLDEVMDCGESALGGWFNYYMSENMENIKHS